MINLVKNEIIKIFKKKSIYIVLFITLAFMILVNVMYKINSSSSNNNYYMSGGPTEYYEEELKKLDPNKPSDKKTYIEFKTNIEIEKLIQKYGGYNDWRANIIQQNLREIVLTIQSNEYGETVENYEQSKKEYDEVIKKLDQNDWRFFAQKELGRVNEQLQQAENSIKITTEKSQIAAIEEEILSLKDQKQIVDWRLEKNIIYGNNYLSNQLEQYSYNKKNVREYEKTPEKKEMSPEQYRAKQEYYYDLKNVNLIQYDVEHNTQSNNSSDARGMFLTVFSQYEIFIIIIIVMIAGSIVSEEFSKGTIKLLLIKPYKRTTILASKLITCILILVMVLAFVAIAQFVVGGLVQGFDSLLTPAVTYNYNTNSIQEMNIWAYVGLMALGKLPIYILLMTLAFAFSGIFNNSALSITIALLGYMGSNFVNVFAQQFNLVWVKFFVTPNWDLTQYFFGNIPNFQHVNLPLSIIVCIVYFLIMVLPTFIIFKKKNIKNI